MQAKARDYYVFVSPHGVRFPSMRKAWSYFLSRPPPDPLRPEAASATTTTITESDTQDTTSVVPITSVLSSLLRACGLSTTDIPPGITNSVQAAASGLCPSPLRALARERVSMFGCDELPRTRSVSPCKMPKADASSGISAHLRREIDALREILPPDCERRMLGSDHAFYQATPSMRWHALRRKYESAGGHDGRGWARDRRALTRWIKFCDKEGISRPFPIGAPAFSAFLADAKSASTGSKGGVTVEHSLKLAFAHMKTHLALEIELDAPCLFNAVKQYQGDSDSATSPSLWAVAEWERLATECEHPAGSTACKVAVLACWLTLRASHFIGATVREDSSTTEIRLNLARDKDGSLNIWAGCEAAGIRGPFTWWPSFMEEARARGFLVPSLSLDDDVAPDPAKCEVTSLPADSKSLVRWFSLAFSLLGISSADQKTLRFTGHSPRHFLPSIAELLAWLEKFRDEVGRWATGAANAKRNKCGARYSSDANRALQLHLRKRLRLACLLLFPFVDTEGPEAMVPCFEALASIDAVLSSDLYGPTGVGYVPKKLPSA